MMRAKGSKLSCVLMHVHVHVNLPATNETLGIEHCVLWVEGYLVLCSITNQTLLVSEGDV
jgi:hypothetical protein